MKGRRTPLLIAAAVLLPALLCLLWLQSSQGSQFNRNVDEDRFSLEVFPLNGTLEQSFSLKAGDQIQVTLTDISGSLSVSIGQEGKDPVYRGTDMEPCSFLVGISQEGTYRITVTGARAEGRISFQIIRQESSAPQSEKGS